MGPGLNNVRKSAQRVAFAASVAVATVVVDASAAMAQIVQSEIDSEPGTSETTTLVTSSTEVRRSVLGLVTLAFVVGVLAIIYWYKTGQQARERFARNYAGRHLAGQGRHDVLDQGGQWGTEAGLVHTTFATQQTHGLPTFGAHGIDQAVVEYPPAVQPTWQPISQDPQYMPVRTGPPERR